MKLRETGVDLLKTLLIGLVVLGHAIQWTRPDFLEHLVWTRIYVFHMAAFFFVSGYFCYRQERLIRDDMWRFAAIVIPYFAWNILSSAFHAGGDLWFLSNLAFMFITVCCVHWISRQVKTNEFFVSAACVIAVFWLQHVGLIAKSWRMHYLPVYLCGYFLRMFEQMSERHLVRWELALVILLGGLVGVVFVGRPFMAVNLIQAGGWWNAVRFVIAICMSVGLLCVFRSLPRHVVSCFGPIVAIGQMTLGIYAFHYVILHWSLSFLSSQHVFFLTFFVLFVTAGLVKVGLLIPFVDLMLFGNYFYVRAFFAQIYSKALKV